MSSSSLRCSSASSRGKFLVAHPAIVDLTSCSCHRRRSKPKLKLTSLFSWPKSAPGNLTSSTHSEKREVNKKKKKRVDGSVPVVKESTEPYVDFRESMAQIIMEEELYGWDELNDLVRRFLSLNSPQHHFLILGAFADICDGVFSHRQ